MTPRVSHKMTLAEVSPIDFSNSTQAIDAAPAPLTTILMSLSSRRVRCSALIRPAVAMIAVPCWSS